MNTLMMSALAAMFAISSNGTTEAVADDPSHHLANEDSPQQVSQAKTAHERGVKTLFKHSTSLHSRANVQRMDSNADGWISRQEYITYQAEVYGKLRQTKGAVSLRDMRYGRTGVAITTP